jgi:soluble lytic murein transglycosylase-like protein
MIPDPIILSLIETTTHFYSIDPILVKAIIRQESNWNQYSLRYEAGWKYLLKPEGYAKLLGITEETEIQSQKMSWGLGQVMGSVARELGFKMEMGNLFEPVHNVEYICLLIKSLEHKAKTIPEILACYNSGLGALINKKDGLFHNQKYVDSALAFYNLYGGCHV